MLCTGSSVLIQEQVVWAVEGGADYIIGETHSSFGEAEIALKAIKDFGQGTRLAQDNS